MTTPRTGNNSNPRCSLPLPNLINLAQFTFRPMEELTGLTSSKLSTIPGHVLLPVGILEKHGLHVYRSATI